MKTCKGDAALNISTLCEYHKPNEPCSGKLPKNRLPDCSSASRMWSSISYYCQLQHQSRNSVKITNEFIENSLAPSDNFKMMMQEKHGEIFCT